MNKKQAVIILTLLVLIICAGVLAARMNDPLYVDVNDSVKNTPSVSTTKKTSGDYFSEAKLVKTTERNNAITSLKQIAEEKNITTESKNATIAKATKLASNAVTESNIETSLKGKGFQDAICTIHEDPKVSIVIKGKEKLTDQQMRSIYDVATSLSKIKTVSIEVKE